MADKIVAICNECNNAYWFPDSMNCPKCGGNNFTLFGPTDKDVPDDIAAACILRDRPGLLAMLRAMLVSSEKPDAVLVYAPEILWEEEGMRKRIENWLLEQNVLVIYARDMTDWRNEHGAGEAS